MSDRPKQTVLCHAEQNKGCVGLVLYAIFLLLSLARIQQKAKQAKLKEMRQRIKEKKAASIAAAKAKKATKEAETEVMLRPTDTDETRPSKRPKPTTGRATTRIAGRPSASLQSEVRKRTTAAQRSKKRPQTNDGAMSA